MKRLISLCLVFFISITTQLYGQKYGALFLGSNYYLAGDDDNRYDVNTTGLAVGWLLPIHMSNLAVYYKVKAAHHTTHYYSNRYDCQLDYFFSAVNEILVGKTFHYNGKFDLIPQLGFGAMGEAAYSDWDRGFTHGEGFVDLSLILKYRMQPVDVGLMISFEQNIIKNVSSMVSDKRLNLVLVVFK